MKGNSSRRKGRKQMEKNNQVAIPKLLESRQNGLRTWQRVLVLDSTTITTSAGGFILPTAISSAGVSSATSFTAHAALALEYRVRAMEIEFYPLINSVSSAVAAPPPVIWSCNWSSGNVPVSVAGISEGANGRRHNGRMPFIVSASFGPENNRKGFIDGQTYCSTGSSISSVNSYGISFCDQNVAPAGPASTVVFRLSQRWLVEYRSLI